MRLLDRYLFRELLVPLTYCLGGFLVFYIAFDLIGSIKSFQEDHMRFMDCVEFYLAVTPENLVRLMPISLLLALLYSLTNHARHNEITAMRAAGVSLWRVSLPYFVVGLGFSLALFWINENLVPQALEKSEQIRERRRARANDPSWKPNLKFRNEAENRAWTAKKFNLKTGEMLGPTVIWQTPDGLHHEIYAASSVYTNQAWTFFKVEEWTKRPQDIGARSTNHIALTIQFPETPELIKSELKINSLSLAQAAKRPQLSIEEIYNYRRLHPPAQISGERRAMLDTQLYGRIAVPWTCLVVVVIAIPFGARSGRRNVFVGVASSIFIGFAYFVLQELSSGLGTGGYLPPVVAAWLPNILFGGAGIVLTMRVR